MYFAAGRGHAAGVRIDPKSVFFAKKDQKKSILSVRTKKDLVKKEKTAENVYFNIADPKELILFLKKMQKRIKQPLPDPQKGE